MLTHPSAVAPSSRGGDPGYVKKKTGSGATPPACLSIPIKGMDQAMSLRAFNARILTTLRAGFALTVIISPGLKGLAR